MRIDPDHIGIWGRTKSGKTTRARAILSSRPRVIAVDPAYTAQFTERDGYVCVEDELSLVRAIRASGSSYRIAYRPDKDLDPPHVLDSLVKILECVQLPYIEGRDDTHLTLYIDELVEFFPNRQNACPGFSRLCSQGRHAGIGIVASSQRMAKVHTDFRGNTTQDYFFSPRAAVDVDEAIKLIGREHRGKLCTLRPHEYLHWKDGQLTTGHNPPLK